MLVVAWNVHVEIDFLGHQFFSYLVFCVESKNKNFYFSRLWTHLQIRRWRREQQKTLNGDKKNVKMSLTM